MITINDTKKPINGGVSYDYEFKGLSTDTKPTKIDGYDIGQNSLFLELDTGDFYYFDGTNWQKVGG